jgi:hypothetical protein
MPRRCSGRRRMRTVPDHMSIRSRGRRSSWPATNGSAGRPHRRASSEASEVGRYEAVRMRNQIVVGLDDSPSGKAGLQWAAEQA